jgi:hypothetical protein
VREAAPRAVVAKADDAESAPLASAAPRSCLNCGALITGSFCSECGQRAIDPDPTLREFLHDAAEGFLNWDGKLLGTLRLLVTSPGALTREYLAGRRVRFISPLRVYLTCSFLYFFVKAMVPDAPLQIRATSSTGADGAPQATSVQIGVVAVQQSDERESIRELEKLSKQRGLSGTFYRRFAAALRDKSKLSAGMAANTPRVMFILVPLYAALVGVVFRRRRMRYPQHLAFALHVHAFLFLALLLTLATRLLKNGPIEAVFVLTSFTLAASHLVLATRRVYDVSTRGAIARSVLVGGAYFVAYLATMALLFVGVLFLNY